MPRRPAASAKIWPDVLDELNTVEMWERLAYYNLRVMAPIYIMQADNPGGLHLTAMNKGTIYAWWAAFQSLLPIVTGGFADRFGFKRTLGFSVSLMMSGYLMLAFMRDLSFMSNYWALFAGDHDAGDRHGVLQAEHPGRAGALNAGRELLGGLGPFTGSSMWAPSRPLPAVDPAGAECVLPGPAACQANSKEAWRNLFLASALFSSFNLCCCSPLRTCPPVLRRRSRPRPCCGARSRASWRSADRLDGDHVVLLADDVPALGPAAELHRGLGGQPGMAESAGVGAGPRTRPS
jgi:MFS family permease